MPGLHPILFLQLLQVPTVQEELLQQQTIVHQQLHISKNHISTARYYLYWEVDCLTHAGAGCSVRNVVQHQFLMSHDQTVQHMLLQVAAVQEELLQQYIIVHLQLYVSKHHISTAIQCLYWEADNLAHAGADRSDRIVQHQFVMSQDQTVQHMEENKTCQQQSKL